MSFPYNKVKTVVTGELITASDRNSEHDNHINNNIPENIDDYSTNTTEMQTNTDPYPAGTPSLAISLSEEIERLRYLIKQITGEAQWYIDPDISINDLAGLKSKIVDIGDWNMDATVTVSIAHGLTYTNIRAIKVTIRDDVNTLYSDLTSYYDATSSPAILADSTNVILARLTGSPYDTTDYNATSYNRGWITIWYV